MKDVVLITKLDSAKKTKVFLDLNKVTAIELSQGTDFRIYFNNTVWVLPIEEFDYVMNYWKKDFKTMKQYQDYINN